MVCPEVQLIGFVDDSGNQRIATFSPHLNIYSSRIFPFVIRGVSNPQLNFDAGV
jgi:hypothetical protein